MITITAESWGGSEATAYHNRWIAAAREIIRNEIGDGHPRQQEAECRSLLGHAMLNPSLHNRADVLRIVLLGTELLDMMEEAKQP